MSNTTIQIDKDMANDILELAKQKWPMRKIKFYAEAAREIFLEFISENKN